MDAFLKMIDDLQTPKHKTNHIKYRRCFPQYVIPISSYICTVYSTNSMPIRKTVHYQIIDFINIL
jgi:hypothetical protein